MYLDIPVLVEIVDASDAAAVTIGVINMADIPSAVAWVTGNHSLERKENEIISGGSKKTTSENLGLLCSLSF